MKIWTWKHSGFHGLTTLRVMVPDTAKDGDAMEVTATVAKRLNDAVCGMADCRCGEAVAGQDQDMGPGEHVLDIWIIILPKQGATVRGDYPQTA